MARIAGVDLPRDKRVEIGLTYIYGIGVNTADKLLEEAGVSGDTRVKDLTDDEVKRIADALDKSGILVEGELRRDTAMNIKRLEEIRNSSPEVSSRPRTEDEDECPYPEGSQEDRRKQEKVIRSIRRIVQCFAVSAGRIEQKCLQQAV